MSSDIKLKVSDISCDHCKKFIESAIKALPGISKVDANLSEGIVDVSYDPKRINTTDIRKAIVDAGYNIDG